MIFNQFEFLLLFLPLVVLAFFGCRSHGVRIAVAVSASFVFYGVSGLQHAAVLALDIVWVYAVTHGDGIVGDRRRLAAAVVPPVLFLVYFKYSGFLLSDVLGVGTTAADSSFSLFANIVLPAGISFFTFQVVAYAVDRYRGDIGAAPPFAQFALFVSFFPQLVAGPIVRYSQVRESIAGLGAWRPGSDDLRAFVGFCVVGLGLKVLGADPLARYAAPLLAAPDALTFGATLYVLLAYSFQIYFDFLGYSLIAIGLGRLFGFALPHNFLRPYESRNPKDFWRRWHVTLSYWIRDYLYLPLGGNRRYVRNILLVFGVCGLWHGAGWNFVVWGLYHAVLVGGYGFVSRAWDRMPAMAQIGLTFLLVSIGWLLFLFDLPSALVFLGSLVGGGSASVATEGVEMWIVLSIAAAICFGVDPRALVERGYRTESSSYAFTFAMALVLVVSLMFVDVSDDFIYFRF